MSGARAPEAEKRKQSDGGENGAARKKAKENDAVGVEEEEVEEFFAILQRLHVAIGHFKRERGSAAGRELTEEGSRLRSLMEETEIGDGVKHGGASKPEEATEENLLGIDLNTEPDPGFLSL